jgi:hypothetical protein
MTADALSRLRAGLAEAEGAANFALELERPYREMTDQTAEVSYEWVRHTRLSNGGSGAMFVDGAPAPEDVLRTVEAIRKVIDKVGLVLHWHSDATVHLAAEDIYEALASIYPADETEGTNP